MGKRELEDVIQEEKERLDAYAKLCEMEHMQSLARIQELDLLLKKVNGVNVGQLPGEDILKKKQAVVVKEEGKDDEK